MEKIQTISDNRKFKFFLSKRYHNYDYFKKYSEGMIFGVLVKISDIFDNIIRFKHRTGE